MKGNPLTADDPRITAYALGELPEPECAAVQQFLTDNPEARVEVEETKALASRLASALRSEASPELRPDQLRVIRAAANRREKIIHFPAWLTATAWPMAAAATLVMAAWFAVPALRQARSNEGVLIAKNDEKGDAWLGRAVELADQQSGKRVAAGGGRLETEGQPSLPGSRIMYKEGETTAPAAAAPDASHTVVGAPIVVGRPIEAGRPEVAPANEPAAMPAQMPSPSADSSVALGGVKAEAAGAEALGQAVAARGREVMREYGGRAEFDRVAKRLIMEESPPPMAPTAQVGGGAYHVHIAPTPPVVCQSVRPFDTETYDRVVESAFLDVRQNPLSTFSIDVDTGSYSNVRRFLRGGQLPPAGAVRAEELLNYFEYEYPPAPEGKPFSVSVDIVEAPWNPKHRLARIGLRGREIEPAKRPPCNLVFLLDVSGSMNQPNKLPLVKQAMKILLEQLDARDRIAIVTYAGASGLALPSTTADRKRDIREAIDALRPGGSTNGEAGIQLAYDIAKANAISGGANRVILATDGDFNIGVTSRDELLRLIEQKAKSGVFLTVLGFGMGNLKDATLEQLADKGNGTYGYIDGEQEARRLFARHATATLVTIAKDVKIQVEFNPGRVGAYRLIGYENRALRSEDFNDDRKDAGEIGSGHTVTALYELVPPGETLDLPTVDALKYQAPKQDSPSAQSAETMTVKLRYKKPDGDVSDKIEVAATDSGATIASAGADVKFVAAVAEVAMILRESPHRGSADWRSALDLAMAGKGADPSGDRAEFIDLVRIAEKLTDQR